MAGDDSDLAQLLSNHVRSRVRSREVVRAALPTSLPLLAVPLLAAAWLGTALDAPQVPDPLRGIAPAIGGVAGELRVAEEHAYEDLRQGTIEREQLQDIAELARQAAALAQECERLSEPSPPELADQVEEVCRRAEELADGSLGSRELREALDRVATYADAARHGLDSARDAGGGTQGPRESQGGMPGGQGDSSTAAGAPSEPDGPDGTGGSPEDAGPDLANAGADGTMSAPEGGSDAPDPALPAPEAAPAVPPDEGAQAGGVGASRWWSTRYDGVVGRWIEDRRARRAADQHEADPPD